MGKKRKTEPRAAQRQALEAVGKTAHPPARRFDLRDAQSRLDAVSERYQTLVRTRDEQARIAVAGRIPGGETGLFERHLRLYGRGEEARVTTEFVLDVALVGHMRTCLETVHQLSPASSTGADRRDEELKRLIVEGRERVRQLRERDHRDLPEDSRPPDPAKLLPRAVPRPRKADGNTAIAPTPRTSTLDLGDAKVRSEEMNDLHTRLAIAIEARGHSARSASGGAHNGLYLVRRKLIGSGDDRQISVECVLDSAAIGEQDALLRAAQRMEASNDAPNPQTTNSIATRLRAGRARLGSKDEKAQQSAA